MTTHPARRRSGNAQVPSASSDAARQRMLRTRRRDTTPELALRKALHRVGLRYRVDVSPIKGVRRRADVVFLRQRIAVYIDGCFWHSCPIHATSPKANQAWWAAKLKANQQRDLDTNRHLVAAGWLVLRFWEHENPTEAALVVRDAVLARRFGRDNTARSEPPESTSSSSADQ
jgi:DNA mismatch endonuclease, patch repair protein